ncbi:hypothetical protein T4E_5715 [Trichinella pseudospiralis]|uniref:Uncharacterized protein n=1 Tax=Trichinella pseudospiralis TaxID=6337 RepID=A0A0V0Y1Y8_TRIPS|nr:hypothetical protein T4E_5715 [Trichinella pseudospiralis]
MLLDLSIIWPSISSWALWLHMTVSNQRNLGAAVEATDVSTVSQSQILKILNLNHFVTQNRDQKRFSKFNLICIYQQILLAVEDIPKTLSQHLSACMNTLGCSLVCGTLCKLSKVIWLKWQEGISFASFTWTTC